MVADLEAAGGQLVALVEQAVSHGLRMALLRARSADPEQVAALATALRRVLSPVDGALLIAGPTDPPISTMDGGGTGLAAVHLAASQPFPHRRPSLVGRSCHDAAEVDQAVGEGCDYLFVSPVYLTASKPGYGPALGPNGLAALCRRATSTPVYALGGVLPDRVGECLAAGAYGVAVMGPVLRQPALVADYLSALKEVTT